MGTLKSVCSYLSREIGANQLEHTLLRVPMVLLQSCRDSFQVGAKGKILRNQFIVFTIFQHFSLVPPWKL